MTALRGLRQSLPLGASGPACPPPLHKVRVSGFPPAAGKGRFSCGRGSNNVKKLPGFCGSDYLTAPAPLARRRPRTPRPRRRASPREWTSRTCTFKGGPRVRHDCRCHRRPGPRRSRHRRRVQHMSFPALAWLAVRGMTLPFASPGNPWKARIHKPRRFLHTDRLERRHSSGPVTIGRCARRQAMWNGWNWRETATLEPRFAILMQLGENRPGPLRVNWDNAPAPGGAVRTYQRRFAL